MCAESIPASSGPGTWSHNLGHSQDEFNFGEALDLAGSPVQEQRMCSLTSVAKLYCGSLLATAESKDLQRTALGEGRALPSPLSSLLSSLLSPRREPHGIAESAGFGHGQCFPCLSPLLRIFIIWGNFLLGLLYIYYGEFLLFKIF